MKKYNNFILVFIFASLVTLSLSIFKDEIFKSVVTTPIPINKDDTEAIERSVNYNAYFEIYTNNLKRTFTDPMYHNKSENVYITSVNPSLIYITKQGIKWSDFFKTLPMELTKECLVTGTKQRFCTNENQTLKFFINDNEDPNALETVIQPESTLKVIYN